MTDLALEDLFNGTVPAIQTLSTLIANGQLIEGYANGKAISSTNPPSNAELQTSIALAFYAFCIPDAWIFSGNRAFVLDAGCPCGQFSSASVSTWMGDSLANATSACYNGAQYYLVYPAGTAQECDGISKRCVDCAPPACRINRFSEPPGLDTLDGSAYGGVTLQTLVNG
jgi:hypothetical protein